MDIKPVTLQGWGVRLAPLSLMHGPGLAAASGDGDLWKLHYTSVPETDDAAIAGYIETALASQARGDMLPFAVIGPQNEVLGCTRYYEIEPTTPTLAIGYTWYATRVQRTHVNSACKRLLLGHAFDDLGMAAVYFHTSHENLRSQAAITRLGAKHDGVIRHHRRQKDGSLRDTYAYSILREEWPAIRDRLERRLAGEPLPGHAPD